MSRGFSLYGQINTGAMINKKNSFHNLTEEELTRVIGKAYCDGYYKCHFNGPLKELETLPARQYAEEVIKNISKKKAEQLKSRDSSAD